MSGEELKAKAREAALKLADMPVKGLRVGEKPYVVMHALDRDALVDLLAEVAHPLPEQPQEGEDKLPCDIKLPPATLIRAGCSFKTLRVALSNPNRPKHFPETAAERQARAVMMPQSGSVTAPSGGQSYGMLSGCMDFTEPSPPSTETKESGDA